MICLGMFPYVYMYQGSNKVNDNNAKSFLNLNNFQNHTIKNCQLEKNLSVVSFLVRLGGVDRVGHAFVFPSSLKARYE